MRRLTNIFVITLVALALCADRATAAAPIVRPHISQVTRQVVRQLTKRFQQVVPAVKIVENRQDVLASIPSSDLTPVVPLALHTSAGTPFQFRLPPPAL
ncbi:MAG TPA: hypothetical protein VFE58_18005 [Tepidisphaeraceae bacterium]|jgi:hypothetical protein|nr:hypothetical protein [Tepidisphaeraceae bacterium]